MIITVFSVIKIKSLSYNTTPTTLNAMVAVGIVFGAAAQFIRLETVRHGMPAGIMMGGAVVILSVQHHLLPAYGLQAIICMLGGFFIVPLNALLQHLGQRSAGNAIAIAVQNFAMLLGRKRPVETVA